MQVLNLFIFFFDDFTMLVISLGRVQVRRFEVILIFGTCASSPPLFYMPSLKFVELSFQN
jgi:hypothetical protein